MAAPTKSRLERRDYEKPALELARRLLGCRLFHRTEETLLGGRIVEVEAYTDDPASHAAGGKRTPRNRIMFGPAGFAYVYFTYGMHHCFNVVSEGDGYPGAVLIRGLDEIEKAAGPALVCRALRLARADNGRDLVEDPDLWIEAGRPRARERVIETTRIGIRRGTELPLRLYLMGSGGVSKRDRAAEKRAEAEVPGPASTSE